VSREKPESKGGGLQVQTLIISAFSSVAAATIVPLFWVKGTVIATAMTPVIVALSAEALRRPAQHINKITPRVARRTATGAAVRRFDPVAAQTAHPERVGARGDGPERFEPAPGARRGNGTDGGGGVSADDPFGLRKPQRRSWWKAGVATGLVAFLIAAAVVTASELTLFGGSIGGGKSGSTTLFGGGGPAKKHGSAAPSSTPTASPTPGSATQKATPTPSAAPTTTPTPSATPAPTVSPQATPTIG
jgi:hypothetical protein